MFLANLMVLKTYPSVKVFNSYTLPAFFVEAHLINVEPTWLCFLFSFLWSGSLHNRRKQQTLWRAGGPVVRIYGSVLPLGRYVVQKNEQRRQVLPEYLTGKNLEKSRETFWNKIGYMKICFRKASGIKNENSPEIEVFQNAIVFDINEGCFVCAFALSFAHNAMWSRGLWRENTLACVSQNTRNFSGHIIYIQKFCILIGREHVN